MQDSLGGTIKIVILAAPKRPHEGRERREAEPDRDWYQL